LRGWDFPLDVERLDFLKSFLILVSGVFGKEKNSGTYVFRFTFWSLLLETPQGKQTDRQGRVQRGKGMCTGVFGLGFGTSDCAV